MARVKLKNEIKGRKRITYTKKHALYGDKCDACGKLFNMKKYCNDQLMPGSLSGIFDRTAVSDDGRSMGNMFSALVCSFKCADKLFTGGWKKMEEYKPYADDKAVLVRVQLGLTSLRQTEKQMIKEWEEKEEYQGPTGGISHIVTIGCE